MIHSYKKNCLFILLFFSTFNSIAGNLFSEINSYVKNGDFNKQPITLFNNTLIKQNELDRDIKSYELLLPKTAILKQLILEKNKFITIELPNPSGIGIIKLQLILKDIYSSDFRIQTSSIAEITPLPVLNYRGIIAGDENSFAAISIYQNEVMGLICNDNGNFNLGKLSNTTKNLHIFYNDVDLIAKNNFHCSTTHNLLKNNNPKKLSNGTNTTSSANCVNFYWETDQDIFTDKGSIGAVTTYINGIFNQVAAEYANDGITALLSTLYIWNSTDPYVGPSTSEYLDQFGTTRTSFNGDLATLLGYNGNGGIAWLDVLCDATTSYRMAYTGINPTYNNIPTFSWTVEVVSHEQGHNLGSEHTHDCVWNGNATAIDGCGPNATYASNPGGCSQASIPAKGTIMSYCHLSPNTGINLALGFGTQPKNLILNRIANAGCLTICGISNDDICNAISLTVSSTCTQVSGNNTGATNSAGTIPAVSCDGNGDADVWYTATVPASGNIEVNTFNGTLTDMAMAIYSGTCASPVLINCYAGGNATTPTMPDAILTGLTPGATLWIRLWNVNSAVFGTYSICATDPVICSASVSITGPTTACSASAPQLCATAGFVSYAWSNGGTTRCITPTSTGSYTVTVTDGSGCTATATHSITINTSPSVTITGSNTACLNTSPQLCTNTTFTSYLWSTGATTQCISPTSSNNYVVTVTNASGCTASASKSITIFPNFTPTISGDDSSCSISPAQLCSSAGNFYSWSSGQTTQCITPTSTGTYTVTVTNANGCTATASKTTSVYTNPTANITGPSSGCSGSTIQICANVGSYSYAWSNAATTSCLNLTGNGTYTVTITDSHGCTSSATKSVVFTSTISVSITGPTNACPGSNPQLCADAGFVNYSWSSGQTSACITPATSGTYTVTVSDGTGCSASNTASFNYYSSPSVSISGPASACTNSFPQLCASGGFTSYQWSSGETTQCIAPTSSNTYTIIATDANGCTASSSQSIVLNNNPTVSISGPGTVCPGTLSTLCATTNGNSLLWSNSATTNCISVPDSGSYSVIATNVANCTSSTIYHLNYFAVPTPTITGPTASCFGTTAQLCAPNGYVSYSWSNGQTTSCINVTSSGTYTVMVTDANGCSSTETKTINFGASLNLTITGPSGVCPGQSVQLCASVVGSTSWSTGSTTQCITPTSSATYNVTVTDANGCTGSASKTFIVYNPFSASISGPTTACYGTTSQLCAPSNVNYTYLWASGETTRCINASSSGIYNVTVTNINGCTATGSRGLTIYSRLNATIAGPNSLCVGAVGQLCAPTGSASYQWSTGNTSRCINVNSSGTYTTTITDANGCTASNSLQVTFSTTITTVISGTHTPCAGHPLELCVPTGYSDYAWNTGQTTECITVNANGIYSVTIHDATGCVGNDTQQVTYQNQPALLIAGQNNICSGQNGVLCSTSGYPNYLWNNGSTQSCITVDTAGQYSVTITDNNGCTNSASINVTVNSINPSITLTPSGLVATPSGLQYSYDWYFAGTQFTGCTGDTCSPVHTGNYTVIITDMISGCIDSATTYFDAVSVYDSPVISQINLYPNPLSSSILNIEFNFEGKEKIKIDVTSLLGQILLENIFEKSGEMKKEIDLADFAAGIYLIHIKGDKWNKTWKIVKE